MKGPGKISALAVVSVLFACGGEEQPPLDQLTLRDALLADPTVIAQLGSSARQNLSARFTDDRMRASATISVPLQTGAPLVTGVLAMDSVRFSTGMDALLTGTWRSTSVGAEALAFTAAIGTRPKGVLPAWAGDPSGITTLSEERALAGAAGAAVEELLRASGARQLERVVAWPVAALATDDTVYVNAAWLVALDEQAQGSGSAATSGGASSASKGTQLVGNYVYLATGEDSLHASSVNGTVDSSDPSSSSSGTEPINGATASSGSSLCDSSSSSNSSCSSCDNSNNSCNSSSSSTTNNNSCSTSSCDPQDKACCRACTVGAVPTNPLVGYAALLWLFLPLGFLLSCEGGVVPVWLSRRRRQSKEGRR
jgi:hypothetical protein